MQAPRYSLKNKRVFVAGDRGMAGSAIIRRLQSEDCEIIVADRAKVDLMDKAAVDQFYRTMKPEAVFMAAGKVGGIHANNTQPVEFLMNNLQIAQNTISAAFEHGTEKLMFLGSSCIYPKMAAQPMSEDMLLTGALEPTNEWYAIAKIAGIKICQAYRRQFGADFISVMPTNLYGPGDNYHPEHSHVPAALIRRFHEAKMRGDERVTVWGTGKPMREFLHVDDLADGCVFVMQHYSDQGFLNIGTGQDLTIAEFATTVKDVVGFGGELAFDPSRPDGTPRKLLDMSRLHALGWRAKTKLRDGLVTSYAWFLDNVAAKATLGAVG
jgi:GDP-L-fucose synthase